MAPELLIVGTAVFNLGTIAATLGVLNRARRFAASAKQAHQDADHARKGAMRDSGLMLDALLSSGAERRRLESRVVDLLEANNRYQAEARAARGDARAYAETAERLQAELDQRQAELVERREEIDALEVELTAARADAIANESEANRWATVAHWLGYKRAATPPDLEAPAEAPATPPVLQ